MCTLIGDTNLDFLKWQQPEDAQKTMVDRTKSEMETEGFTQIIRGITRTWRTQTDSLVDQCWVNRPDRVISHTNETRGSSDHNFISVLLRTKDKFTNSQEVKKRCWKSFCPIKFREMIGGIDWG